MKDHPQLATATVLSQSVICVALLGLFAFVASAGGIGLDEPPPLRTWVLAGLKLFGIPMLWSVAASLLLWRRSATGWWLSVTGDALLLVYLLYTINDDIFWHTLIGAFVLLTGALLLSPSARNLFLPTGITPLWMQRRN